MNAIVTQFQVSKLLALTNAFQIVHAVNYQRWLTVKNIHIANVTAGAITVQICFVFIGVTPISGNASIWNFSVPANDFIEFGEGQKLPPGTTVQALASAGASINVWLSGIEETLPSA